MLRIPVPVKIPFPSEHLSGAIDSEAEHEEEEDEEEDVEAASSSSNSGGSGSGGSGGVLPSTVMEELSASTSSAAASGMPITQPNDDSQESQDPMEEVRTPCFSMLFCIFFLFLFTERQISILFYFFFN